MEVAAHSPAFHGTPRFRLVGRIGQGATGFVYEAVDRERNARVALKTLRAPDPELILLLKNEFRAIQDLSHPNLVTPKELFEEAGQWFFTMDLVEGTDFLSHVRPAARGVDPDDAALDEARLRAALGQLVLGLCALHADHKVHRDIKPSNILVSLDGRVHILDFGIVHDLTGGAPSEAQLVGTVVYMAPEQAGGDAITPAADWYAVGALLYQALTGRVPFEGNVTDVLTRKANETPPPPNDLREDAPKDLAQLAMDLMRPDASERPEGFEILARLGLAGDASPARGRSATFIGRSSEIEAIEAAYAQTAKGNGVTLLVEGESGIGKSWLLREFARRAAQSRAVVLRGRCYERESLSYKAVDGIIDDLAAFLASLPEAEAAALLPEGAGALRHLFPALRTVPALRDAPSAKLDIRDPYEARARMFDLLRELFVNVARVRRLVLVIDDLHWADTDSLALLTELQRPPNAPALLLLASMRIATVGARGEAEAHARVARMPGDVRSIRLEGLPLDDARALLRELLSAPLQGRGDLSTDIDGICEEAKGHPMFLEEIVRHRELRERASGVMPATRLDDAVWERTRKLDATARKVLELVAVAGVPLPQHVAARAGALDPGQLFDAVGILRAAHLVRTSGVYKRDTVEAYHDRVRESVAAHLDESTRKACHRRVALALEQSETRDPEQLLSQWLGAGEAARAAGYALEAAAQAAKALAFEHAASLYRTALDLTKPRDDAAVDLKAKLAEALTNAGRGADAAEVYLDAAGDATATRAIDLRRLAGEQLVRSGRLDDGVRTFESVLAAAGVRAPRTPLAIIASLLFTTLFLRLRGLGFASRPETTIDPRDTLRVDCLASAGNGFGMSDHVRGKEFQFRTLAAALKLGEPRRAGRALGSFAIANASMGTSAFAHSMAIQSRVAKMARELGDPFLEGLACAATAFAHYLTGQGAKAREPFERAEAIFRDRCVGVAYELGSVRSLLYRTLIPLGELSVLAKRSGEALRDAEDRGDILLAINVRFSATSFLALARDDVDDARRAVEAAATHLSTAGFHVQHTYGLLARVQVWTYEGDAARAEAELAATWRTIERSLILRVQNLRVSLHEARARACVAAIGARHASSTSLRATAERLLRALDREGWTLASSQARLLRAGLARVDGDRAGAIAHVTAAEEGFASLGLPLFATIARRSRGVLLVNGGESRDAEEGAALVRESDAWMRAHGIENPARMAALFAPAMVDQHSLQS